MDKQVQVAREDFRGEGGRRAQAV